MKYRPLEIGGAIHIERFIMERPDVCKQCELRCMFAKRSRMVLPFKLSDVPSWCRKKETVFAQEKKESGGTASKRACCLHG